MNGVIVAIALAALAVLVIGPYVVRWPGMKEKVSSYYGWIFLGFIALMAAAVLLPTFGK